MPAGSTPAMTSLQAKILHRGPVVLAESGAPLVPLSPRLGSAHRRISKEAGELSPKTPGLADATCVSKLLLQLVGPLSIEEAPPVPNVAILATATTASEGAAAGEGGAPTEEPMREGENFVGAEDFVEDGEKDPKDRPHLGFPGCRQHQLPSGRGRESDVGGVELRHAQLHLGEF